MIIPKGLIGYGAPVDFLLRQIVAVLGQSQSVTGVYCSPFFG